MSMSVNSLGSNMSMLAQLQKMQQQMHTLSNAARGISAPYDEASKAQSSQESAQAVTHDEHNDNVGAFANMLKEAFENVNLLQNDSSNKQTKFDLGDRSVTLSDVMLASQKASISFEATLQIRNKMLEAYKTVSQMQV